MSKNTITPATWTLMVVVILLSISTFAAVYGFNRIHASRDVLVDLYQLKSDVLQANIALRNAAVAHNQAQSEAELAKMLVTRSSANDIYDRLTAADLCTLDRVIVDQLKKERPEYRAAQLTVVNHVRKGDKVAAWDEMTYYQTLMDRYINRLDKLITSVTGQAHDVHIRAKSTVVGLFGLSVALSAMAIWRGFRGVCIGGRACLAIGEGKSDDRTGA